MCACACVRDRCTAIRQRSPTRRRFVARVGSSARRSVGLSCSFALARLPWSMPVKREQRRGSFRRRIEAEVTQNPAVAVGVASTFVCLFALFVRSVVRSSVRKSFV